MEIYLDTLIITNLYINIFTLKATSAVTHTRLKPVRLIISALIGSLSSLLIIVRPLGIFAVTGVFLLKIAFLILMIAAAFCKTEFKRFLKLTAVFLAVNLFFGGAIYFTGRVLGLRMVYVQNFTVYLDFSLLTLMLATIAAYIAVCIINRVFYQSLNKQKSYRVVLETEDKSYELPATADTGNFLSDSFSGKPVIVCKSKKMLRDININDLEKLSKLKGFRYASVSTVSGNGVIPIFLPDKLFIKDEKGAVKSVDAFIGVSKDDKGESCAVFNPKILV